MNISYQQRLQINHEARERAIRSYGVFSRAEVGSRYHLRDEERPPASNLLLVVDEGDVGIGRDTDLYDFTPLLSLKTVEDHPSGEARLDLYVSGGGELLMNLLVTLKADGTFRIDQD